MEKFLLSNFDMPKHLDYVLDWFVFNANTKPSVTISDLTNSINSLSENVYDNDIYELTTVIHRLVSQLVCDGYVKEEKIDLPITPDSGIYLPDTTYSITANGISFKNKFGYVGRDNIDAYENSQQKFHEELLKNQTQLTEIQTRAATDNVAIQKKIATLTMWIAFASIAAIFYYATQLIEWFAKLFHYQLF